MTIGVLKSLTQVSEGWGLGGGGWVGAMLSPLVQPLHLINIQFLTEKVTLSIPWFLKVQFPPQKQLLKSPLPLSRPLLRERECMYTLPFYRYAAHPEIVNPLAEDPSRKVY